MRCGHKWLRGNIVDKKGINVYDFHIIELEIIWKRHCNQLLRYFTGRLDKKSSYEVNENSEGNNSVPNFFDDVCIEPENDNESEATINVEYHEQTNIIFHGTFATNNEVTKHPLHSIHNLLIHNT